MPRDLSEVLHYFMPELAAEEAAAPASVATGPLSPVNALPRPTGTSVLPTIALPIGDQDVVRAAFAWNLAVEVARLGGRAIVVTPGHDDPSPLWPEVGIGPLGAELVVTPADDLAALYRVAVDIAVARADGAADGGLVFVRVPPAWLREAGEGAALLRWTLLFTSSHGADLRETYGISKLVMRANRAAQVGITIHGAKALSEAENAFTKLAQTAHRNLRRDLLSYGLLVDDLHVYRAIVAQRPIGLEHPQSPAARALRDVAQMVLDDARKRAVA